MHYIKYDEYELLELFESEPIPLNDEEAGMFFYIQKDKNGFKVIMYISIYENSCELSVSHENLEKPIFQLELHEVKSIKGKEDRLIITRKGKENIVFFFKPNYSLEWDPEDRD
ncbi:hypothetical protein JOD24_000257 [Kroppenstedtia sanguinis]|uniref:Uncharacterized protein n=1 Tax=Kroppenstedtia sanguinis TaxID=1380684 RepID=A0ABW4C6P7_9BACL